MNDETGRACLTHPSPFIIHPFRALPLNSAYMAYSSISLAAKPVEPSQSNEIHDLYTKTEKRASLMLPRRCRHVGIFDPPDACVLWATQRQPQKTKADVHPDRPGALAFHARVSFSHRRISAPYAHLGSG